MKKVYIIAPFEVNGRYKGGINFVATNLYDYWKENVKEGYEFEPINTCLEKRTSNSIGKINLSNIKNMLKLIGECNRKTKDADVVYSHSSIGLPLLKDLIILRDIKRKKRVKTVLHIHYAEYDRILTKNKVVNKLILYLLRNYVDKIIFLSSDTRDEFVRMGDIDVHKTEVIYNFCDIQFSEDEIRKKIDKENDYFRILFMGSIDKRKGIVDLLRATENIDNITVEICGGINDKEVGMVLNHYLKSYKGKYHFRGYVSGKDKTEVLYNTDIFVLPSCAEGLPIGIIEAFATGCAVITTDVGAIPEVFGKENGYMIKPNDVKMLNEAILKLVQNAESIKSIGMHNWEYSKKFSIGTFSDMVLKTFG